MPLLVHLRGSVAVLLLVCGSTALAQSIPATFTVGVAGDVLLDRGVRARLRAVGPAALLKETHACIVQCDAVIANLECPATLLRAPLEKKFVFRAEPRWLFALREAGITHLTLANNHSNDQGRAGLVATVDALRAAAMTPLGAGATQDAACAPVLLAGNGVRLAVFASVPLPLENWMFADSLAGPCQATAAQLAARIRAWKREHPEDAVLVLLHWGREFHETPEPDQVADAHALVDAGADAIAGHHPHVVQRVECYRGKPILYSIGNFLFDQRAPLASRCVFARFSVGAGGRISTVLHPFAIRRCAPVPMHRTAREQFRNDLERLSPGVRLTSHGDAWIVETSPHAAAGARQ